MTKKELEQLLIEANKLFVDANEYLDKDKIACLRIILKFKNYSDVFEKDNVKIEDIMKAILELSKKYYEIVNLYYFEGKSLKEIASIVGLSPQRIGQLDDKIICQIKNLIKKNAVKQNNKFAENKEVPISCLNLSARTYNALTRTGVETLGDLLECSYEDLKRKRNMGKKCIKEIEEQIRLIYPGYILKSHYMQIDEIYERYGMDEEELKKLSVCQVVKNTKYTNTLLRNRVFTVSDLISLTSDQLRNMNGLGKKGYEEIENTLNTLLPDGFRFQERIEVSIMTGLVFENECDVPDEIRNLSIWELNLSARATNGLTRKRVDTIGQLLKLTKDEILSTRNIGVATAEEVAIIIKQHFPFWEE